MLSRVHEWFVVSVVANITSKNTSIANNPETLTDLAQLVRAIQPWASIDIFLPNGKHSSDASFGHTDAFYPGVVIEISYMQKRKDLRHLAYDYLIGSKGNVRLMICLDIEDYGGQKRGNCFGLAQGMANSARWRSSFGSNPSCCGRGTYRLAYQSCMSLTPKCPIC